MNSVIKIVVLLFLTALAFFYGWFFAQHHSPTASCPTTSNQETQPLVAVSTPKVDCPKVSAIPKAPPKQDHEPLQIAVILNKNPKKVADEVLTYENTNPLALERAFTMYAHPSHPQLSELLLRKPSRVKPNQDLPYDSCDKIYLTRTGSLANMPNKCMALVVLPDGVADPIPHNHRRGKISGLENMYQGDYIDKGALRTEAMLLPEFLVRYDMLIRQFKEVAGDRKEVIIMVLNEGVLDVFVNWVCSLKSSNPPQMHILDQLVVFVGQAALVPLLRTMGVKSLHDDGLGRIPAKAADAYGDMTFAFLMWLKTTSVLIGTFAGYDVLFQDVDLVWMEDPMPVIRAHIQRYEKIATETNRDYVVPDVYFMDDGARTPRFTPLYVNSGFYYVRATEQSRYVFLRIAMAISQIATSHSHQSVLTRAVHEAIDLFGLRFAVLDLKLFPSGFHYHHEKKYMASFRAFETRPNVFHMCWTESRKQKVEYLSGLGLWFLPNETTPAENQKYRYDECGTVAGLKDTLSRSVGRNLLERCCIRGDYWTQRDAKDNARIQSTVDLASTT